MAANQSKITPVRSSYHFNNNNHQRKHCESSRFSALLPQPLYSTNIAPADFYQFPKLNIALKGKRFESIEDIQANMERDLIFTKVNFQECFQSGNTVGVGLFSRNETTLKEIHHNNL
ncbi:UNVERIFIED_CONTAM: hypothetical protein RMT77_003537 [Armadillidium vulgare]